MKIALINPPRSPYNGILEHASEEAAKYIHKKLIGPPLGLLTLAANLKDFDVCLLEMKGEYDLNPESPPLSEMVTDFLEREKPDIVGVTFIASEYPYGIDIFRAAKRYKRNIITVAGGLHATLCPEDFEVDCVDYVCLASAAHTFRSLVQYLETGADPRALGGLLINKDGQLMRTRGVMLDKDPAGRDFVTPDRSLLQRWLSTYVVGKAPGPSTYLFTSLGCPYTCSFCSIWPQYKGKYLQREVESVVDELKSLDEYDVVRFSDANTLVNLSFAERLFDRIREENIRKTFIMDIRVDTAAENPLLIEKLAQGGLKVVICGFESIRQEELKKYNKKVRSEQVAEAIRVFHANDIMLRGNYIVPTEYSKYDFQILEEYAASHPVNFAGYTILTPFPGTPIYQFKKENIVDHDLMKYNMFNAVTETTLPLQDFYERVSSLWLIRRGTDII